MVTQVTAFLSRQDYAEFEAKCPLQLAQNARAISQIRLGCWGTATVASNGSLTSWSPSRRRTAGKHTADEEESLFPRLRQTGEAEAIALLERMESLERDHECASKAHDDVDQMGQRWLDQGSLNSVDAARLVRVLDSLASLYRRHIEIEDSEVFPAASKILSAADRKSVGEEMAGRRGIAGPMQG